MTIYRMSARAEVCFDIEAATEAEAYAKAREAVRNADGAFDELAALEDASVYLAQYAMHAIDLIHPSIEKTA